MAFRVVPSLSLPYKETTCDKKGCHQGHPWWTLVAPPLLCFCLLATTGVAGTVLGWQTSWRVPLIIANVALPCCVAVMFSIILRSRAEHRMLLERFFPPQAVKQLRLSSGLAHISAHLDGTPVQRVVGLLSSLLQGRTPTLAETAECLAELRSGLGNLYLPEDIVHRTQAATGTNLEAADALLQALTNRLPNEPVSASCTNNTNACTTLGMEAEDVHKGLADMLQQQIIRQRLLGLTSMSSTGRLRSLHLEFEGDHDEDEDEDEHEHNDKDGSYGRGHDHMQQLQLPSRTQTPTETWTGIRGGSLTDSSGSSEGGNAQLLRLEAALAGAARLDGCFDAQQLAVASMGRPLSMLGYWVFMQSGLVHAYGIKTRTLLRFLQAVEDSYNGNAYHSSTHAAHVLQVVHALLSTAGLQPGYADNLTTLACYIAAIVHDCGHKGVTNDFLVHVGDELAMRYNDRAPHENHHVSLGFSLLSRVGHNFLEHLPKADQAYVRRMVIDLVLATDMKQHFAINGQFATLHQLRTSDLVGRVVDAAAVAATATATNKLRRPGILRASNAQSNSQSQSQPLPQARTPRQSQSQMQSQPLPLPQARTLHRSHSRSQPLSQSQSQSQPQPQPQAKTPRQTPTSTYAQVHLQDLACELQSVRVHNDSIACGEVVPWRPPRHATLQVQEPLDEAERLLTLQMMIKCADLAHTFAPLHMHLHWVNSLQSEMFAQGDRERQMALAISPLCDRHGQGITSSQVGFFEMVVMPLLVNFTARFPAAKPMLVSATANYQHWKGQMGTTAASCDV